MPTTTSKPAIYVCKEAFGANVDGELIFCKAGDRVPENHRLFKGESGRNRREGLFRPADEA